MKITPWCADDEASSFRHNELRDLEAEMLKIMECNNFQIEPDKRRSADTYEQSSGYPARHSRSWLLGAARICPGEAGGYFRNFWVGMCRCDPATLNLYQSKSPLS